MYFPQEGLAFLVCAITYVHGGAQSSVSVMTSHTQCHCVTWPICWDMPFVLATVHICKFFGVLSNNTKWMYMLKIFSGKETSYISHKCELSPNCLPNVSLRRDLNVSQQQQQLWTWLAVVFCLEFKFQSIYRAIFLINSPCAEIYPQKGCFNMVAGH